jgi:hypothetical protein
MILSALYEYYQRMVNDESSGIPTPGYTNQQLTHIVEICQTASKSDPPSASNFDPLRACL